ncbi:hypothetical protein [Halopiger goleimassiliensis]|nr:hypothetical protein [Halopiger goleimassiliensis]
MSTNTDHSENPDESNGTDSDYLEVVLERVELHDGICFWGGIGR